MKRIPTDRNVSRDLLRHLTSDTIAVGTLNNLRVDVYVSDVVKILIKLLGEL